MKGFPVEGIIYLAAFIIVGYAVWKTPPSRIMYGLVVVAMLFVALTPTATDVRDAITDGLGKAVEVANDIRTPG